jgi:hypothetical protein
MPLPTGDVKGVEKTRRTHSGRRKHCAEGDVGALLPALAVALVALLLLLLLLLLEKPKTAPRSEKLLPRGTTLTKLRWRCS